MKLLLHTDLYVQIDNNDHLALNDLYPVDGYFCKF